MNGNTHTSFSLALTQEQCKFAQALYIGMYMLHTDGKQSKEDLVTDFVENKEASAVWSKLIKALADYDFTFDLNDAAHALHRMFTESGTQQDEFYISRTFGINITEGKMKVTGAQFLEDFLAQYIQEIIARFDLPAKGYQVAFMSDLFDEDDFGGVAFYVSKDAIKSFSLQDWLDSL